MISTARPRAGTALTSRPGTAVRFEPGVDYAARDGAVRFEPGQSREVTLVRYAGAGRVYGFNGAVNGALKD